MTATNEPDFTLYRARIRRQTADAFHIPYSYLKNKTRIRDRLYWFSRNLLALALFLIFVWFYFAWIIISTIWVMRCTDGRECIRWP